MKIYFAGFPGGSVKNRPKKFLKKYARIKKLYSFFYEDYDWFKWAVKERRRINENQSNNS